MKFLMWCILFLLSGCTGMPDSVEPVRGFELNRYLGTWYEIARLDHSFERGLEKVTATYQLRDDGGVSVLNKGFSPEKNTWKEAEGRAYFVESADRGYLKVSFFGPFFGSYIVFGLDHEQYQYAFVSGPDTSYLWLLSRSPEVSPEVRQTFVDMSQQLGFDTNQLIWVQQ
ncbi:lipocalin family protein [Vibrio quintilis]|uniref:Outer membrane lipoprotein Blc n=1 Tax=Vibrio quintilis TaxID=1117707 RepID=A0A1M7YUS8_9VIBR|nr:lipocalin family protein [Vibrio quintilis]SHO56355.1 Outer membrane lipoprotein Blc precursor [Vibrio quintilis]